MAQMSPLGEYGFGCPRTNFSEEVFQLPCVETIFRRHHQVKL